MSLTAIVAVSLIRPFIHSFIYLFLAPNIYNCCANRRNDRHRRTPPQEDKQDDFLHHHSVSIDVRAIIMLFQYFTWRAPQIQPMQASKAASLSMTASSAIDLSSFPKPPSTAYVSQGSHMGLYRNQRTRNQFRPRNTAKGTSSYQLRQYAEATLGGGSLRKIVKLPEGEDENEWLAVNSMYLFFSEQYYHEANVPGSGRLLQPYQSALRLNH